MRIAVKHLTITDAMSVEERNVRANLFREEMRLMSFISSHPHVMRLSGVSPGADPFDLAICTDFMINTVRVARLCVLMTSRRICGDTSQIQNPHHCQQLDTCRLLC
jgi:hypothetical protein